MTDIPNELPEDFGEEAFQNQGTQIQVGVDLQKCLILLKIGKQMIGLPVPVALQISHSLNEKALKLLFRPPEDASGNEPDGLYLP